MSLSVVIPTIGRPSLKDTLLSCADLTAEDEIVVVADGPQYSYVRSWINEINEQLWHTYPCELTFLELPESQGCYGHPARNQGFLIAKGTHWATIDDDDVYLPGAFDAIRAAIGIFPDLPIAFRCRWGPGHFANGVELWRRKQIVLGEIATPMVVAPASSCRFGLEYTGDYSYAKALETYFGMFAWDEHVIAEVRPEALIPEAPIPAA